MTLIFVSLDSQKIPAPFTVSVKHKTSPSIVHSSQRKGNKGSNKKRWEWEDTLGFIIIIPSILLDVFDIYDIFYAIRHG